MGAVFTGVLAEAPTSGRRFVADKLKQLFAAGGTGDDTFAILAVVQPEFALLAGRAARAICS
jgi:hypothetical protein